MSYGSIDIKELEKELNDLDEKIAEIDKRGIDTETFEENVSLVTLAVSKRYELFRKYFDLEKGDIEAYVEYERFINSLDKHHPLRVLRRTSREKKEEKV